MRMSESERIIKQLQLAKHPEGGYYRRVYQSEAGAAFDGVQQQSACTAIIYLLCGGEFSAFHRIESDELWFLGQHNSAVRIIELDGGWKETLLHSGNPVHCVKAGTWFAAQLVEQKTEHFALTYCTVSPGFEFSRFELASAAALIEQYPDYQQKITALCHAIHVS